MDYDKTRKLIKELRIENKLSQEQLAEKLFCDRTKINKMEKGRRYPSIDELILLSKILHISLEELIAGERKEETNEEQIHNKFLDYLKSQNTKFKKMRLSIIVLLIVIILTFVCFTIFYFFQNYNSIRVYKFYGSSENYEISDGILIISKEKIYFKINSTNPIISEISIFTEQDNLKKKVYEGTSNVILNDFYGYESFIDYDAFVKGNQKIYIVINEEEIQLNFNEDFVNDGLFYKKNNNIGNEEKYSEIEIPVKIKENFICNEGACTLENNEENLLFNNNVLTVINEKEIYYYDLDNEILEYQNMMDNKLSMTINIDKGNITCRAGDCENTYKIYNDFKQKYIEKYLK